jgi:hypothetical protein
MYGAIGVWVVRWFIVVAQVEVASHSGTGIRLTHVRGVGVDVEDHVTSVEPDSCILVGRSIIEKLDGCIHGLGSALCLDCS